MTIEEFSHHAKLPMKYSLTIMFSLRSAPRLISSGWHEQIDPSEEYNGYLPQSLVTFPPDTRHTCNNEPIFCLFFSRGTKIETQTHESIRKNARDPNRYQQED